MKYRGTVGSKARRVNLTPLLKSSHDVERKICWTRVNGPVTINLRCRYHRVRTILMKRCRIKPGYVAVSITPLVTV